ncbi:MAG: hypothetical protein MPJ24_07015 [Pirellulaceae bacterium]|nr:hypothetical protein [Pirellulaceae bacterium]
MERPSTGIPSPLICLMLGVSILSAAPQTSRGQALLPPQVQSTASPWKEPISLLKRLETLYGYPSCVTWCQQVEVQLKDLQRLPELSDPAATVVLQNLEQLTLDAESIAAQVPLEATRVNLLRTSHAIQRRLDIWKVVYQAAQETGAFTTVSPSTLEQFQEAVQQVEKDLASIGYPSAWNDYLLLSEAKTVLAQSPAVTNPFRTVGDSNRPKVEITSEEFARQKRAVAQQMLLRFHSPYLGDQEKETFQKEPYLQLQTILRSWAILPIEYEKILEAIEDYEANPTEENGAKIAIFQQLLRWSNDPQTAEIGNQLERHFRNANFRIVVSEPFLNRFLPEIAPIEQNVNDHILGTSVAGTSKTSTRLHFRLIPDRFRLRLGIEAQGDINSETTADAGTARFFSTGSSRFTALKQLWLGNSGLRLAKSRANAQSENQLYDLETDYDSLPLFGSMARSIAKKRHSAQEGVANAEAAHRIEQRVQTQLDELVEESLGFAQEKFQNRIFTPLQNLELAPQIIDMQTTEEHLVMRGRVASYTHLGAYTPRPRAPNNSLIDMQLHDSLLNNLVASLDLANRELTLKQLSKELQEKLNLDDDFSLTDDKNTYLVRLKFASEDPVTVRFQENRLMVQLKIKKMFLGRRKWKDFTVTAYYSPQMDGLSATLSREKFVELSGKRLGLGDQIALRSIFHKVFSKNKPFQLVPETIVQNPKLDDIQITQFAIHDGWLGLALGMEQKGASVYLTDLKTFKTKKNQGQNVRR